MTSTNVKFDFSGHTVLVTGSTLGIGKAIATAFVQAGARVIVNGRKKDSVDATVAELSKLAPEAKGESKSGAAVHGVVADCGNAAGVKALVAEVDKIGEVDVLINNVGIFYSKDIFQVTDEEWHTILEVNVMSIVRLTNAYLPRMLKRNKGRIVNIGSEAGLRPIPHMIHYSTTKTAILGLTRGYGELTKGTGVTVNNLAVGPTYTEGVADYLIGLWKKDNPGKSDSEVPKQDVLTVEYFEKYEPTSLLKRFILPTEIAATALFVSSAAGASITGSNLRCEGGIVRSI